MYSNRAQENKRDDWYDKWEETINPLHFKKLKVGAKNKCGSELEAIIPSGGEVRMLGNRNRQCTYYMVGVDVCHSQMI